MTLGDLVLNPDGSSIFGGGHFERSEYYVHFNGDHCIDGFTVKGTACLHCGKLFKTQKLARKHIIEVHNRSRPSNRQDTK